MLVSPPYDYNCLYDSRNDGCDCRSCDSKHRKSQFSVYQDIIEDKVDAIDMDEQHGRYLKRGEVAVKRGDYIDFFVFIICPDKYYEINDEAKKYYMMILAYQNNMFGGKKECTY